MNARLSPLAIFLLTGLLVAAFALSIVNLNVALPYAQWRQALWQPDIDNIAQMLFHYSLLPRLAISLLVGAGLGLVGVLFQQVLRNPLAEPTTLGVATGAQLGMTVTTLWAIPGVLASQFAALAGACLVGALVFGVSWGKRLSPVTLILAGLVVSLLLRRGQSADGDFPSRSAAKHVPVEYRHPDADRLERGATPVAAAARRRVVDAVIATPVNPDGTR